MNVLIIGCGKVGSALAAALDKKGHDVSVVDRNEERFEALPGDFAGFTTTGVPIDTDVLKRAGIQTCDALFTVTDDDDTNLMAAQLAKQLYGVPNIFSKITDIGKGEVFAEMGLNIICPTKLTVSAACSALEGDGGKSRDMIFGTDAVSFYGMDVPEKLVGETPSDIEYESGEALFGVIRGGAGLIMYSGQPIVFAEGDRLIFARKA